MVPKHNGGQKCVGVYAEIACLRSLCSQQSLMKNGLFTKYIRLDKY